MQVLGGVAPGHRVAPARRATGPTKAAKPKPTKQSPEAVALAKVGDKVGFRVGRGVFFGVVTDIQRGIATVEREDGKTVQRALDTIVPE